MDKLKVLFICVHNSARSQMAEAFLNNIAGEIFLAESAGYEPGNLNPMVVEAMQEIGIDISNNKTKSVFDFFKEGRLYHYVITVCDDVNAERCPIFPGVTKRLGWSFEDPSSITGSPNEQLAKIRIIRDKIRSEIENFIKTYDRVTF